MRPTGDSLHGKDKQSESEGDGKRHFMQVETENRDSNTYIRSSTCIEAIKQASTYLCREI